MECGSTKFLVGLGIGSAIGALVYHYKAGYRLVVGD